MQRRLLVPILSCLVTWSAFGAEEEGFTPMFNGRDLSGWVNANCAPETWSVTNGMIHCTGRPTGAIRTERQYENFIMEVEWRHLSSGGNSGIFIWGTPIAAPAVPFLRGIEVQVLDHGYNVNGKNQWYTTHGDVFPIHGASMKPFGRHNGDRSFPSEERSKPSPEWNHYRIVCTNGTLRLSVNGKEVSGGENCNYRKGYLALESEGAPVQFRNLRIKELPTSNPNPAVVAPLDEGFRTIFTGLDLRGWKAAEGWSVEGERLRAKPSGKPEAALLSEKEHGDAAFIFDIRTPKDTAPASQPAVVVRGVAHPLQNLTPGAHNRVMVTSQGQKVTIQSNYSKNSAGASEANSASETTNHPGNRLPARGAFGFRDNGVPLELMNVYARDLP